MSSPPSLEPDKAESLRRMQRIATGCVVAALLLRIGAGFLPSSLWVGYLRAFSEAAVVGGLADWFAVTALFRHPFGLRIPHTRILPQSKDRIAKSLSDFVISNFLNREVVEGELSKIDLSGKASGFVHDKADRIATRLTEYLPRLLKALDDEDISHFLETQFTARLRKISAAPAAGRLLEILTSGDKHERIVDDLLKVAEEALHENQDVLTGMIRSEIPMPDSLSFPGLPIAVPLAVVKDKLASKIAEEGMKRLLRTLSQVRDDPAHEIRRRIHDRIARLVVELKQSPEMLARGEEIKNDFLANPNVATYAATIWMEIKQALLEDAANSEGYLRKQIASGLRQMADQVLEDSHLREKLNVGMRDAIGTIIAENAPQFARMIQDTVKRWDGEELGRKLELEVGRDLQFVRVNGTLVGGVFGVLLHLLTSFH